MLRRVLLVLAVTALAAAPSPATGAPRPVPAGVALPTSGPALLQPPDVLAGALACEGDVAGAARLPVLLVHGTGSTPEESWDLVVADALRADGHPVCTVALPERATGDMQVSTEQVVAGIRAVAAQRGGRISVVGHSQGATLLVRALQYWPDLPDLVEDYVGLAPTFQPGLTGEALCAVPCSAPFQQRRTASAYFTAVRSHPLVPGPSYTTIATRFDEIAAPAPEASRLDGAVNLVLQDRCPAKAVEHFGLLVDGTVLDLVRDGLAQDGPVDPARLPDAACGKALPDGVDPVALAPRLATSVANDLRANQESEKLDAEPPVRCYVAASCTDVDDRGRLLLAPRLDGRVLRAQVQAPGTVRVASAGTEVVVPVAVGPLALPLPAGALGEVRVETSTSFYAAGVEAVLALPAASVSPAAPAAAPARPAATGGLAATGGTAGAGGLVLVAAALVLARARRRA